MKKLIGYLAPIGIMLLIFYIAGCLIENTFSLGQMRYDVRAILFGIWLAVSGCFSFAKAISDIPKSK